MKIIIQIPNSILFPQYPKLKFKNKEDKESGNIDEDEGQCIDYLIADGLILTFNHCIAICSVIDERNDEIFRYLD